VSTGGTRGWEMNGSIAPISAGKVVARRTLEALRTFEPDVLHLHEPLVPGPTQAALLGSTVPIVATFHVSASRLPWYQGLRVMLERWLQRMAVRTAVSEDAKRLLIQNFGERDYRILPNGVDYDRFVNATPTASTRPAILFVGRHEERKGLSVLIDAFAELDRDADLWVAGDGPETDALRARNVRGVQWLGRLSDAELASRVKGATVFCAPALYGESFGVVLLEGMAAGTPIVASDIDGYRNVVRDGREALLAPPGDSRSLGDRLRRLLDDPALAASLGATGQTRAREFSMTRLTERYHMLYDEAINAAVLETR
jgi:phosphatidylinositol alpha-mannosyltransferase